ncbi:AtzE family amidohydrolase [Neokomagataea thailandica]|uniref:Amidase n=1 Tax=Neokomagataea tanensis NBRC 106556 TaxID=1223519 RepID=A0ABQ0QI34_9PROT|nr:MULTISPECIES: AtzE family amidohydrolase [Neokomagataea]GBR45582.1 amidase [Neokomagataea tanensis NBRC 106556]
MKPNINPALSALPRRSHEIPHLIRSQSLSAVTLTQHILSDIKQRDPLYNTTTRLLTQRALSYAQNIDNKVKNGVDPGPLAGIAFGIKDLFDVTGEVTTAGSKVLADAPPASQDAVLVHRLIKAGAIPVALTNMDEFAYGFATDNAHHGPTHNPHDTARLAGGSSGGSAAGIAARFFGLSLGSDTNGSIRVPASLCGVWGLRATQGRLPTQGSYPFVTSLDTVGPFADSAEGLTLCFEALTEEKLSPVTPSSLNIARLGGWFSDNMSPSMQTAFNTLANTLHATRTVHIPEIARARAAAFIISASEGAALHLDHLRHRADEFDPAVRDRLLAGALIPAPSITKAHRFRSWFRRAMHEAFNHTDILLAPAVVGEAPRFDQPLIHVNGAMISARANLGLYTQPLTLAGFPVLTLPMPSPGLPLGAQLIAKPGREDQLLALAQSLEHSGAAQARLLQP